MTNRLSHSGNTADLEFIQKIDTQSDRIIRLLNELMDVSKIESGQLTFTITDIEFDRLLAQVIKDFSFLSDRHQIILKTNTPVSVKGDRDRFTQVLINLLTNAVKYSPKGGKIIVKSELIGKKLQLSVRDHGIGIPKNKQTHVFDKYYRTSAAKEQAQGLGMGLFICKQIIKRHHGQITVISSPKSGSTFTFTLPASPRIIPSDEIVQTSNQYVVK